MSGSTFTMLLQMRNKIESLDCLHEQDEPSLDAPQLRMQPNLGEKLKELLHNSLVAQSTPMD